MRAAVLTLALLAFPAAANEKATHRALIADHANGKLTLVELPSGRALAHYGVEGPARLKANETGRLIYATQGKQNRVNVLDSGIGVESHGDHNDVSVGAPKLLDAVFAGGRPSHVNEANGVVAVFFDETGAAATTSESALLANKARMGSLKANQPHHGVAAPLKEHFAISVSQTVDGREVPSGLEVLRRDGGSVAKSMNCPRLHGEGRVGSLSAFGCSDGILLLTEIRGKHVFDKIGYPDSLPRDRMVRNLAGSRSVRSFLGDFGADGMVVIDPVAKNYAFVQLPGQRMAFARDPVEGEKAFVLTADGRLHAVNALTGKLGASLVVTEPYSMEGGSSVARPRVSSSGGLTVVTDPAKGRIHVVDGAKMVLLRSVELPGAPFDVVVVGARDEGH